MQSSQMGRRPRRLVSLAVAALVMVSLVGACGSSKTTSSSSSGATTATASASTGADPGTCPSSNTTSFAKTKFLAHAGLAFGAFHRYLYNPFKAGTFSKGASGRIKALLKGVAAAAFITHEVRLAAGDVQANPTLCKLIAAPLSSFSSAIGSVASRLKGGDTSAISEAQTHLSSVTSAAGSQGVNIVPNPNASV